MKRYQPNALNHEPLLFWTHLDNKQRADLAQALQQIHGVNDRDCVDGICLGEDTHEFTQPVVLPVEEAEHHPHKLRILDKRLLGPVDHGMGNKLLQCAWQAEYNELQSYKRMLCIVQTD